MRIRSANPPIVRSRLAFTIAERDLQPEGIAFDARSRSVFAGSFKGKIVRVDQAGRVLFSRSRRVHARRGSSSAFASTRCGLTCGRSG